tara:strand:- start:13318 stop:14025 length:708 start_codon:yes stop_codon:yes gene_type:complete
MPARFHSDDLPMLKLCIWSGPLATLLALLGMVIISGFVPATNPAASGADIADFYVRNVNSIRFGMIISMTAFSLFVPFGVAIAMQTRRMEATPILTYMQIVAVAIAALEGIMSACIWITAAFRPDAIDPDITRMLHDLGWICFLVTIPPFSIWIGAVGMAILRDKHAVPLFSRNLGYFNLWVALLITPAMVLPFFKTGPFAYNGILALYLPFGAFFLWMIIMTLALFKSIQKRRP